MNIIGCSTPSTGQWVTPSTIPSIERPAAPFQNSGTSIDDDAFLLKMSVSIVSAPQPCSVFLDQLGKFSSSSSEAVKRVSDFGSDSRRFRPSPPVDRSWPRSRSRSGSGSCSPSFSIAPFFSCPVLLPFFLALSHVAASPSGASKGMALLSTCACSTALNDMLEHTKTATNTIAAAFNPRRT